MRNEVDITGYIALELVLGDAIFKYPYGERVVNWMERNKIMIIRDLNSDTFTVKTKLYDYDERSKAYKKCIKHIKKKYGLNYINEENW